MLQCLLNNYTVAAEHAWEPTAPLDVQHMYIALYPVWFFDMKTSMVYTSYVGYMGNLPNLQFDYTSRNYVRTYVYTHWYVSRGRF